MSALHDSTEKVSFYEKNFIEHEIIGQGGFGE
jgi:hypothetical protein